MGYRPICDLWILARPKVKYYGAYPSGFLERAKPLIGCGKHGARVLHCCGGLAKEYPYDKGFLGYGNADQTMDTDPMLKPDILGDATDIATWPEQWWDGIIIDPPYTKADAAQYRGGNLPKANLLLKIALQHVPLGGMVGMLHYIVPQPPRDITKFIACVGVFVGYNNRMRAFSVFQRRA